MKLLKNQGFMGVKIHPDYQGTYIDDDGYAEILNCAREYDMIVVTHAGLDVAYPDNVHCTPDRVKKLLEQAPHHKLVLAHLGGVGFYPQVIELLCDENVYFDTAVVLRYVDSETLNHVIKQIGADRILFASDSPWSDVMKDLSVLKKYVTNPVDLEKILSYNAKKLLEI